MAEWGIRNVNIFEGSVYDDEGDAYNQSITAFEVIEHLDDPQRAMDSISDSVLPGALAYVTVPKFGVSKSPDYVQDFHDGDIGDLMRAAGLYVLNSYDIAGHWRMTIGMKP